MMEIYQDWTTEGKGRAQLFHSTRNHYSNEASTNNLSTFPAQEVTIWSSSVLYTIHERENVSVKT
jgi:hypothetical protein